MKKISPLVPAIFVIALLTASCIIIVDGKWDDNIGLSTRSVEFGSGADSTLITTQGKSWWISNISVNGKYFYGWDINPESTFYTIKEDCFTVTRKDAHTLFIRLDSNRTGTLRVLNICLEAGDYFDNIQVTQKSR